MEIFQFIDDAFWSRTFLGVPGNTWLSVVGAWSAFALGLIGLRRFVTWRLSALAKRTHNEIDDVIAEVIRRTTTLSLVILGLYLTTMVVELPDRLEAIVTRIAFLALLLQFVQWGNRAITIWIEKYRARKLEENAAAVTSMQAVGFLGRFLLWVVAILLALDNFGIEITTLVAGLGVGGVAVALAVQNILGDLFASLSIVLDKPFVVGDFLILDQYMGTVEQIGLKTTRIRSLSGEQIILSNGDLLKSRIRNYKRMFERRVVFSLGVVYQTPPDQLARISALIREIIELQDRVRFDRAHFKAYGDFSLIYEVVYYVLDPDYNAYMDIQEAINIEIYRRFAAEGIEFAYPTQTLYVSGIQAESDEAVANQ